MTYRYILLLVAAVLLASCAQEQNATVTGNPDGVATEVASSAPKEELPTTVIDFGGEKAQAHDFGKITEGEKVTHTFRFKNTGDAPLQITAVKPSCGCTTPDYTKEPIAPGEEGFVEVMFNSTGRAGTQNKSIQVFANTAPRVTVLTFTGEVVE